MPTLTLPDATLRYRLDGPDDGPPLLLSNSLGTDLDLWSPQLKAFATRHRVIRYDVRGHGASSTPPGPYALETLGRDALALLDHLDIARTHFVGISMGGLTGLWLEVHAPERLSRVVVANTGAKIGTAESWNERIAALSAPGTTRLPDALIDAVVERWFTPRHRRTAPAAVAAVRDVLARTGAPGYAANCAAIRDADLRADLASIRVPTLVVAGSDDPSTPARLGRDIADAIPGARYVELDAAHLSNVEQAGAFNAAVLDFLGDGCVTERERVAIGESMRRSVLGDAHVDRSEASRSALNGDFLDYIARTAWGETWTRPGLDRRTRSLLTIAMMVALNRPDELRLHLNAARNNGVSRDDVKEVLMQAGVYCGVPAANAAFHLAAQVFAEQDRG